jgi:2-dehydro-3-deoxygluconokinase
VIEKAVKKFPNVKAVATTLREVHSTNRHTWSAVAWIERHRPARPRPASSTWWTAWAAATVTRPASSTACSAEPRPAEAVNLGWAHGALLTTFPGDTTMATVEQVKAFRPGRFRPHSTLTA